jgi:long-chain acyl-CoA synthetase
MCGLARGGIVRREMPTPKAEVRTLAALWSRAVAEAPSTPAFLVQGRGGWREVSWQEAGQSVDELAAGFLALGIRRGERVAILARTRLEWTLCDWALIAIGALPVPIYPTSSALECSYVLGNCGARFVVCEDAEQEAKVAPARRELEALEQLILFEGGSDRGALGLSELRERGRALLAADPGAVERARAEAGEEDVLTIVYTSGTTGPPKGCLLSNRNYFATVEMVAGVEGLVEPGDCALLYLPLAHTFARLVEFLAAATHLTIAFCPEPATIPNALREVRPTLLPSVPRLYERLAAAIRAGIEERQGLRRTVAAWALRVGYRASARRRQGRRYSPLLALEHALAERLVLVRVRQRLGGRLRIAISGGAPLAKELAEFFHALGFCVLEGYGLTECTTAATFNRPGRYRLGTAGPPLEGVELRLAEDGEILIRGEIVFGGYYHNEEATREVLTEDGWLRTGDLGVLDADGFLTITDRKKDIIVTTGGKNFSPQNIEIALEASPYVNQALVVGDRRPYLVALLALDDEAVRKAAHDEKEARALVEQAVAEVNRKLGRAGQVRRFAILPRPFSQEESELTPTLKLRRRVCAEHFRDEIDRLYAGSSAGSL